MAILPMGHMVGADDVDISFPDIDGSINSDQTWSGNQTFGHVMIQAGVTVTVSPGAVLKNYDGSSSITIEGNLTAIGTEGSPIVFGDLGSSWNQIWAIGDGSIHMENCSVLKGEYNLKLDGGPSYLKNVTTVGGILGIQVSAEATMVSECTVFDAISYGILATNLDSGLEIVECYIENCGSGVHVSNSMYVNISRTTIVDMVNYGISVSSSQYTHVDSCTIEDGGNFALSFNVDSAYGLVENSRLNGSRSGAYIQSDHLTIRKCDIDLGEGFGGWAGLYVLGIVEGLLVEDSVVNNCRYGMLYGTDPWSDATFKGTSFGPNVEEVLISGSSSRDISEEEINVTFEHCALNGNITIVHGLYQNSWVEMINSTWNQELEMPFNTSGGEVNISWLLDFKATDGNGDLTPFNLLLESTNGDELIDIDVNSGYVEDVEIPLWHVNDTEEREVLYDLTITSLVDPNVKLSESGEGPYGDTLLWIEWDLPPTNSLLDPITLDEDERVTWNLSEYFVDPEGQPIEYEILGGPDTYFDLDGLFLTFGGVDDFNGETWMEVSGTDEGGNTSFENVTITVLPVN
ncbi:MAG: right-handed parallel beta-helix repeat-containing protein, partial [Thermoplasmata archaeon]|nr:right-handed parallel beta-helix repeat-containing protein [Thermoplasmata archaeon]